MLGGTRLRTGNLRDYGIQPGDTIEQALPTPRQPAGVPLTPQVPSPRVSIKPRTPSPKTPRDGMNRAAQSLETNSPRGTCSNTLRYDPSWHIRPVGSAAPSPYAFPATPGGTLAGRSARPPTATELALASRRGTQSKPMPWSAQYKASSSQGVLVCAVCVRARVGGWWWWWWVVVVVVMVCVWCVRVRRTGFGVVNPNSTLTPRHYGDFPPVSTVTANRFVRRSICVLIASPVNLRGCGRRRGESRTCRCQAVAAAWLK